MKKFNWEVLFSHNHWITLKIKEKRFKICARCLGVVAGFLTFTLAVTFFSFPFFHELSFPYQLVICLILVSPAIFDWITQRWGLRESNNSLRIFTGFFEGSSVVFLYLTNVSFIQKIVIILFIGALTLNIGFAGERLLKRKVA
ncbi:MAG: DUF2085 domain-containing protein [Candidatus Bathyarchaeota archaeon]